MAVIEDGTGTGQKASVNKENQLEVRAVNTSIDLHQVEEGTGFNVNTGVLTLTTATADTAVIYMKNDDVNNMIITSATLSSNAGTGGADSVLVWKQVAGFTAASDIIANGTDGTAFNRNAGKASRTFKGDIKIGGTGRSFTSAVAAQQTMGLFTTPVTFNLTTIVPVGGEIGVTVDVPALNTSMDIMLSFNFHIEEDL